MSVVKLAKWVVLGVASAVIVLVGVVNFLIWNFDTETPPANHGKVRSELFLADGDNQPLLIGFGGSDGGNGWAGPHGKKQRDILRGAGVAFLSIAYFGEEGLPEHLDRIDIEAIHKEILEVAGKHPGINQKCMGLMGVSRGGELALLMGSEYPVYRSVVGIVAGNAVFPSLTFAMTTPGFSKSGVSYPFVPVPWSATSSLISGDLRGAFEHMLEDTGAVKKASIPVEKINGSVFLLSSVSDEQWPSKEMSDAIMDRLELNSFPNTYQHTALPGGHSEHFDNFDKITDFLRASFLEPDGAPCLSGSSDTIL